MYKISHFIRTVVTLGKNTIDARTKPPSPGRWWLRLLCHLCHRCTKLVSKVPWNRFDVFRL